jgi:hypothetical protein
MAGGCNQHKGVSTVRSGEGEGRATNKKPKQKKLDTAGAFTVVP